MFVLDTQSLTNTSNVLQYGGRKKNQKGLYMHGMADISQTEKYTDKQEDGSQNPHPHAVQAY